jgi:hypothetical protein
MLAYQPAAPVCAAVSPHAHGEVEPFGLRRGFDGSQTGSRFDGAAEFDGHEKTSRASLAAF